MKRGPDRGYFTKLAKSLFILDTPGQEEATKQEFAKEWLVLNFVSVSRYLGAYLGPQAELEAWVKTQVEAWAQEVRVLAKISRRYPQSAYAGLGMLLQSEWQYLERTVPRVGTLMGPIEEAPREKISPRYLGGRISQPTFGKSWAIALSIAA